MTVELIYVVFFFFFSLIINQSRRPTTLLSAWPIATQQIQKVVLNGTMPAIEIIRRGGDKGGSTSRDSSRGPGKEGSETSSDSNSSPSASNPAKTGEESEWAYLEAHARIFKDFVQLHPETQASGKQ